MSDLARRMEELRSKVDVGWDDERARRVERGMVSRRARRRRLRVAGGAVVVVAIVLFALFAPRRANAPQAKIPALPQATTQATAQADERAVRTSDGSRVELLGERTELRPVEDAPARVEWELLRGRARFDVTPRTSRLFRVRAGKVAVEVLGTAFVVARDETSTEVTVERGRVRVIAPTGEKQLSAGESARFEEPVPVPTASNEPVPLPSASVSHAAGSRPSAVATPHSSAWRELAERGDYDGAWGLLRDHRGGATNPAELLLEADVARLSRHPAEAVAPLRELLTRFPGDSRAPLAAFTLGRVLLDDLGRPREAAEAFARARAFAPEGALAEDALAREVEAWSRAGDTSTARARAEEYERLHPEGRRLRSVRRFGGLE